MVKLVCTIEIEKLDLYPNVPHIAARAHNSGNLVTSNAL